MTLLKYADDMVTHLTDANSLAAYHQQVDLLITLINECFYNQRAVLLLESDTSHTVSTSGDQSAGGKAHTIMHGLSNLQHNSFQLWRYSRWFLHTFSQNN